MKPPMVKHMPIDPTYQTYELHASLIELRLHLRERAQLRRTHGSKVGRVREQNGPFVADPLMKINVALGGFGGEVGRGAAEAEARLLLFGGGGCERAAGELMGEERRCAGADKGGGDDIWEDAGGGRNGSHGEEAGWRNGSW